MREAVKPLSWFGMEVWQDGEGKPILHGEFKNELTRPDMRCGWRIRPIAQHLEQVLTIPGIRPVRLVITYDNALIPYGYAPHVKDHHSLYRNDSSYLCLHDAGGATAEVRCSREKREVQFIADFDLYPALLSDSGFALVRVQEWLENAIEQTRTIQRLIAALRKKGATKQYQDRMIVAAYIAVGDMNRSTF